MNRILLSVLCAAVLSGCGTPEESADSDSTDTTEQTDTGNQTDSGGDSDTGTDTDTTDETDATDDTDDSDTSDNENADASDPANYTVDAALQAPVSLSAVVANQQVVLRWNDAPNAVAYTVYYSTEEITAATDLSSLLVAVNNLEATSYSSPSAYLTDGTTYYAAVVAKTSLTSESVSTFSPIKSFVMEENSLSADDFTSMRELNDTGTLFSVSSESHLEGCADGDRATQGQDCSFGRDVDDIASGDEDGIGGFSFTKIGDDGGFLTADSEDWSCVLDQVTGLMWEVKEAGDSARGNGLSSGLHDADDGFTWYEPTLSGSGVTEGTSSNSNTPDSCYGYDGADTLCNTTDYRARVNAEALCSYSDWRLPTARELMSIVYYGDSFARRTTYAIDTDFFPLGDDTIVDSYWTTSPYYDLSDSSRAWRIYLRDITSSGQNLGVLSSMSKGTNAGVILVRTAYE